jgi:hypothetical protein
MDEISDYRAMAEDFAALAARVDDRELAAIYSQLADAYTALAHWHERRAPGGKPS